MLNRTVVVLGPTGVGKSSFIRNSVPPGLHTKVKVGHGIQSETKEIQPVSWINEDDIRVNLVDTPGFDDSRAGMTDAKVLGMIATFLTNEYKRKKSQLIGLVYIHRISDTRIGGTSQRNLRMLQKICGPDSLANVVIVTTMWDMVTPEEGLRREQELRSSDSMFKFLLDGGANMMRHDGTHKSAAGVVKYLLGKSTTTIQIVREIVHENKALEDTAAATELRKDIHALLMKHKNEMTSLDADLKGLIMQSEIAEERQILDLAITKLSEQLEELKRGISGTTGDDSPSSYDLRNSFATPDAKSVADYSNLLQLVKISEYTLAPTHPELSRLVASRAIQFADAVEEGAKYLQRVLPILRSALASESMDTFQQFMMANPHPRMFTRAIWVNARDNLEIVTNDIRAILTKYPKPRIVNMIWNRKAVKRFDALNAILECIRVVVADMNTIVHWWTLVIDALGNVEDASHHLGGTGFSDTVNLSRIISALDSYCEVFEKCPQHIRKAAKFRNAPHN